MRIFDACRAINACIRGLVDLGWRWTKKALSVVGDNAFGMVVGLSLGDFEALAGLDFVARDAVGLLYLLD